jgi:hypothetical protein
MTDGYKEEVVVSDTFVREAWQIAIFPVNWNRSRAKELRKPLAGGGINGDQCSY